MPTQIGRNGAFETDYFGPYGGLNTQQPANLMQDNFTPAISNFIFRNSELRSRWNFVLQFNGPPPPSNLGGPILGMNSFIDINGTNHTVFWNSAVFFQLFRSSGQPGTTPYEWISIPGMSPLQIGQPVSSIAFGSCLFWTNGNQFLQMWDGVATTMVLTPAAPPPFGPTTGKDPSGTALADQAVVRGGNFAWSDNTHAISIGGKYLAELANHMLMANITATDPATGGLTIQYPQRLWWSSSGYARATSEGALSAWDITTSGTGGGFNDFLDTPDNITGLATLGIQGYLFRTNGISQFFATGNGQLPFSFDHLWSSDRGIGAAYPWSVATYGPNLCFVSYDNVYQVGINSWQPIGGLVRDSIMADIFTCTSAGNTPFGQITSNFRLEYVYLGYMISIPLAAGTKFYFYSFEDQNWASWFAGSAFLVAPSKEVWI